MGALTSMLESGNQTRIKQAQVDAARMGEQGSNEVAASQAALANFQTSVRNQDVWAQAGDKFNTLSNANDRQLDSTTSSNFARSIQQAQQLGALAAQEGASGTHGTSVDMLDATARLDDTLQAEQTTVATNQQQYDNATQRTSLIKAAGESTSFQVDDPQLTFTKYLNPVKQHNQVGTLLLAGAATAFGGPMAGNAVLSLAQAGNQMENGDWGNGIKGLDSAGSDAAAGFQEYSDDSDDGGWLGSLLST